MRPRGLGRGLGALIPAARERVTESETAVDTGDGLAGLSRSPQPRESDTVRAVDRWLWRDGEPVLPEGPPPDDSDRSVDVPRGTSQPPELVEELLEDPVVAAEPEESDEPAPADDAGTLLDTAAGGAVYAELDPATIRPNPRQPRQDFDPDALADLVASIHEVGLLQPVVVRPTGDSGYELVMGERRWRAAQAAGLERIPAIVKPTGDDALLRDALLENIQRVQLNPLEEAAAYGQLLEDFGCTQDELAGRLGRSRPQVTNTLRLLKLSPPVQRRVAAGVLSAGHAKALLGIEDPGSQEQLAARVVAEGLSVRSVEEIVATRSTAGAADRRPRRPAIASAGAHAGVAARLSDRLETRVTISRSRSRGRIVIEFAADEDLHRISELIDPRQE